MKPVYICVIVIALCLISLILLTIGTGFWQALGLALIPIAAILFMYMWELDKLK